MRRRLGHRKRGEFIGRKRLAPVALLVVALAAPSAAEASAIGRGFGPGVAVDVAGTAYIAWSGPESPAASLQFCRLPRGATRCDVAHAIAAPGTTTSRAFVTVSGSRVVVVQYRYPFTGTDAPGLYEFVSTNGGRSFAAGRVVGTIPFFEAVAGPGDTLSGVTDAVTAGMLSQSAPLGAGTAATSAQLSVEHPYRGSVGLVNAATPLAVFTNGSDAARFRRYDGSGSLNDVANWTAPVDLGVAAYPKLAGGSSGLFLLASAANNSLFVRKWNGTTFGPPVTIDGGPGIGAPSLHAFQDGGGRLHAVFSRGDADGLHLVHAVSDDGKTWQSGTVLTQSQPVGIAGTRVATAPDHVGVAVFFAGAARGEIQVIPVGPGGGGGAGGGGGGGGTTTAPTTTTTPGGGGGGAAAPPTATPTGTVLVNGQPFTGGTIPFGATVDVTDGTVTLRTDTGTLKVNGLANIPAAFVLRRATDRGRPIVELSLAKGDFSVCKNRKTKSASRVTATTVRAIWGDGKGKFRTRGRYASATIRGTKWLTADRCDGTHVRVTRGAVGVVDPPNRREISVRAPRSYLARP